MLSFSRQDSATPLAMAKKKKKTSVSPILAAGGIVTRGNAKPAIAVVRLRRQKSWVLPKGKLNREETELAAAKREVIEETGHDVTVREYLGALSYPVSGSVKTVKFWRMEASRKPVGKLMKDVSAVRWLPLEDAVKKLTHQREKEFLIQHGPRALSRHVAHAPEDSAPASDRKKRRGTGRDKSEPAPSAPRAAARKATPAGQYCSAPRQIMQALWRWLGR
jgi:8-oxo-dGTP diphosphatase